MTRPDDFPHISLEKAEQIRRDYKEVIRVMSLVEGAGFEATLPEDLQIKDVPGPPSPMTVFRFPNVLYAVEPSCGHVVEVRSDGHLRTFAKDGREVHEFTLPLGEPHWN